MANKSYLPFPLFLLILLVVGAGLYFTLRTAIPQAPIEINEIASAGSVSLSLSPSTITLVPSQDTIISVNADSGSTRLHSVKFELTYDATKLTVSAPTLGTWLTKQLTPITVESGKITGEIAAQADVNAVGTGTIFTFKVKGEPGTYPIVFAEQPTSAKTYVEGIVDETNMLKSVSGTTITINNAALVTDIIGTDHKVNKYDYVELVSQYGKLPAGSADFNHSGAVDTTDYNHLMSDYGKTW